MSATTICRCRRPLIHMAGHGKVCADCYEPKRSCECDVLRVSFDDLQLDDERWLAALDEGDIGELVQLAEELKIPAAIAAMKMREQDWSEDAIQDLLAMLTGWNPRRDEVSPEREQPGPGAEIRPRRRRPMADAKTTTETTKPQSNGAAQRPAGSEDALAGAAVPRAEWRGIPLYNQTAADLAAGVAKDLADGKLDLSQPAHRIEIALREQTILLQEQIYGNAGFLLRMFSSRRNVPKLQALLDSFQRGGSPNGAGAGHRPPISVAL